MLLGDKVWFLYSGGFVAAAQGGTSVFDLTELTYKSTNLKVTGLASSGNLPIVIDDYVYIYTASGMYKVPVDVFYIRDSVATVAITSYEKITDTTNSVAAPTNYIYYLRYAKTNDTVYITGWDAISDIVIRAFSFTDKEFDNNTLVIRQGISNGGAVMTQLFDIPLQSGRLTYPLYNAIHYTTEKGADNLLPLYYGTGTEWVKFKN